MITSHHHPFVSVAVIRHTLTRSTPAFLAFVLAASTFVLAADPQTAPPPRPSASVSPEAVVDALARAGKNRAELERALRESPPEQRRGMAFLIANMPDTDLTSLRADFLLENLTLAYRARAAVAWGADIPDEVFFNNVLPYANLNESRDPWRKELFELCLPLVKDCKTASEAALRLNSTIFNKLKVKYSTERKQPDQSPAQSIASGKASCTGLSILLSDACRSVAVPTRVVGTPLWANKRGNHTWVEIWDAGRWHFTGACEPDPAGLDRGWFVGDAAQAKKDDPRHAIYAASFKKTGLAFPLVWAPGRTDIPAENVTDRYAANAAPKGNTVRVSIRVWNPGKTARVVAPVTVVSTGDPKVEFMGQSRGETADRNDILSFDLVPGRDYTLRVGNPIHVEKTFKTTSDKDQLLEIEVPQAGKK